MGRQSRQSRAEKQHAKQQEQVIQVAAPELTMWALHIDVARKPLENGKAATVMVFHAGEFSARVLFPSANAGALGQAVIDTGKAPIVATPEDQANAQAAADATDDLGRRLRSAGLHNG